MLSKVNFDVINKLVKRNNKFIPKARKVYAVGTGIYVGEMLVYCKKDSANYYFLSIPKNINRTVPIDKFELALEHKIAEFVTDLPRKVYNICYKQFEYNERNIK
jgi:hypothetical protein